MSSSHFEILIDASGSMGYMKGTNQEDKHLLPDGSTRMQLAKKIIINSLASTLDHSSSISISIFRDNLKKDENDNFIKKNNNFILDKRIYETIYRGKVDNQKIINEVQKIKDPDLGGTPLFKTVLHVIHTYQKYKTNIIIISDGDASDDKKFDENLIEKIKILNTKTVIHFIGIAQDRSALIKSKNLAEKSGGIYVNLKAMNYDKSRLDILLSKLNMKIVSKALEENTETLQDNIPKNKEQQNENNGIKLEQQVKQNTSSLKLISSQLTNIINLLHTKENTENEIEVVENEIYNKRIGRQAEQILFTKLKNLFSDKNTEVIWLNEKEEQGLPYDFKIIKENKIFYYECKGTSSELLEFQLTKKEWEFYLNNKGKYRLCFVKNVDKKSKYTRFMNLLEDMDNKLLTPCSIQNKAYKANRLIFSINNSMVKWI